MGPDVRQTVRSLARTDPRGAVWCAAVGVLTVHHLVPRQELRFATAVRLALLWAQGVSVSPARLREAALDARDAAASVPAAAGAAAVAWAPIFVYDRDLFGDSCAEALLATALANPPGRRIPRVRDAHLEGLGDLVTDQLVPLAHPGHSPLGDWLLEQDATPGRQGTLGESLGWARIQRLRWWVPEHRWAAEHRLALSVGHAEWRRSFSGVEPRGW